MNDLITILEKFDRKERPLLFRQVTSDDKRLSLSQSYRAKLEEALGVASIPTNAYVAFDYHLNWLYAALQLASGSWRLDQVSPALAVPTQPDPSSGQMRSALERNQEDIDLLVAWQAADGVTEIALVEAKAYSGWTTKQMHSKAARLALVFDGIDENFVRPHLLLTSFKKSEGLGTLDWPRPNTDTRHIDLDEPADRFRLTQVTVEGKPANAGDHYIVKNLPAGHTSP